MSGDEALIRGHAVFDSLAIRSRGAQRCGYWEGRLAWREIRSQLTRRHASQATGAWSEKERDGESPGPAFSVSASPHSQGTQTHPTHNPREHLSLLTYMNLLLELDLCSHVASTVPPSPLLAPVDPPDSEPCLCPDAYPRAMAPALTHWRQGPPARALMSALTEQMFNKQVKFDHYSKWLL